jgi:hypothetical protein
MLYATGGDIVEPPCAPRRSIASGYGFEKNDRANITDDELEALKEIAEQLLARTGRQLDEAIGDGSLQEICHESKIQG